MRRQLSHEMISRLPVHDAEFLSLQLTRSQKGTVTASLTLEVNPEESMEPFEELGLSKRSIRLTFCDCFQVACNAFGYNTPNESVHDWTVVSRSELLDKLREVGLARNIDLTHHSFQFSGGSKLDILAAKVFIQAESEEPKTQQV